VLSELHLGATYDAVIRRRLWRHRRADVLLAPLIIVALVYALSMSGQTLVLTSIAMYAAVWHRGRQSLGVARYYQRQEGGAVSGAHRDSAASTGEPPKLLVDSFILASRGWCSRMPSRLAVGTSSVPRVSRSCWFSPCIMKCSVCTLRTQWRDAAGHPRQDRSSSSR
jgi:hypothetical protein